MRKLSLTVATVLPAVRSGLTESHFSAFLGPIQQICEARSQLPRRRARRGVSAVLIVAVIIVLIFFVAIAVDMGRVYLAKAEMQTVADAAARAGALSLPVSNQEVFDEASGAAMANPVIETEKVDPDHMGGRTNPGVELDTEDDIVFGIWRDNPPADEDNFIELTDLASTMRDERRAANAVMAWGRRIENRDNPLPLIFGPVLGVFNTDIEKRAVAAISGGPSNFGFIGIDSVASNGNEATVQSMTYGINGTGGGVGSDGDIDLGNGDVYGDARPGIGKSLIHGPNARITGWTANLDYSLKAKYPGKKLGDIPVSATVVTLPGNNKDWTLPPSGVPSNDPNNPKIFRLNVDLEKIKSLTINGYVTLYVTGNVNVTGNAISNTSGTPAKFELIVVGNFAVDIGGNAKQYAHIYAPDSTVRVHGTPGYYGTIIGKTLSFIGTSDLYYDDTIRNMTPFGIRLVK